MAKKKMILPFHVIDNFMAKIQMRFYIMLFNRAPSNRKKIKSKRCSLAYKVDLMPFFLDIHVYYQIRGCHFEEMFHREYVFEHYIWHYNLELHLDRYYNNSNLEYLFVNLVC